MDERRPSARRQSLSSTAGRAERGAGSVRTHQTSFLEYVLKDVAGGSPVWRREAERPRLERRWSIAGIGWLAISVALVWLSSRFAAPGPEGGPVILFTLVMCLGGLLYLYTAELIIHSRPGRDLVLWIVALGFAGRLLMFLTTPILENDYHRYLWDGAVVASGENPWNYAPRTVGEAAARDDDSVPPVLKELAQHPGASLYRINHDDVRTIYPPLTQAAFALAHVVAPWRLWGWRLIILLSEIATLLLLFAILREMRLSPLWAALYWLNPLLLKEAGNALHMDVITLPLLLAAFLFTLQHRAAWAGGFMALSVATKLWPLILAPLLLRAFWPHRRRMIAFGLVALGACGVLLLPMMLSSGGEGAGITEYAQRWRSNDALFGLVLEATEQVLVWRGVHTGHGQFQARVAVAVLVFLWTAVVTLLPLRRPLNLFHHAVLILGAAFFLGPTQFPWYALWMLPFLAIYPRRSLLALTLLMPLYYLRYHYSLPEERGIAEGWWVWVQYIPVWIWFAWEQARSKMRPVRMWAYHAEAPAADETMRPISR